MACWVEDFSWPNLRGLLVTLYRRDPPGLVARNHQLAISAPKSTVHRMVLALESPGGDWMCDFACLVAVQIAVYWLSHPLLLSPGGNKSNNSSKPIVLSFSATGTLECKTSAPKSHTITSSDGPLAQPEIQLIFYAEVLWKLFIYCLTNNNQTQSCIIIQSEKY